MKPITPNFSEFLCESPQSFLKVFQVLAPKFTGKDLLLLRGEMGTGKTTFVQELVSFLKGDSTNEFDVSSPTFGIHNEYNISADIVIHHFDLHRIDSSSDLESTGFWESFSDGPKIICIEWPPEWSSSNWPKSWKIFDLGIKLESNGNGTRRVLLRE